jgi:hypothetical protein
MRGHMVVCHAYRSLLKALAPRLCLLFLYLHWENLAASRSNQPE